MFSVLRKENTTNSVIGSAFFMLQTLIRIIQRTECRNDSVTNCLERFEHCHLASEHY